MENFEQTQKKLWNIFQSLLFCCSTINKKKTLFLVAKKFHLRNSPWKRRVMKNELNWQLNARTTRRFHSMRRIFPFSTSSGWLDLSDHRKIYLSELFTVTKNNQTWNTIRRVEKFFGSFCFCGSIKCLRQKPTTGFSVIRRRKPQVLNRYRSPRLRSIS